MIIAIVANTSWNIYNFRLGILKRLMEQGHTVLAIAPKDQYSESLVKLGIQFCEVTIDNKGNNPFKDLRFFVSLLSLYKKLRPAVILHYTIKPNIYGTFAAGICKIPSINTISGLGTVFLRDGISSRLAKYLYKSSFRFSKKIFFQNASDQEVFLKLRLAKQHQTSVVPGSGIDLSKYQDKISNQGVEISFLFVGRLLYHKGIIEYMKAATILINKGYKWRFLICGAIEPQANLGIQEKELEFWVKNKSIEYLGFKNNINEVIQNVSCVVLPSYREGISRTLLESAALAKPLIASDVPGCREIVRNNHNGYTCLPADELDLAAKMEKMGLLTSEQRIQLGLQGRKLVEESFDEKLVINQYLEAITSLTP